MSSGLIGLTALIAILSSPSQTIQTLKSFAFKGQIFVLLFATTVIISFLVNGYGIFEIFLCLNKLRWILLLFVLTYLFKNYLSLEYYSKCLKFLTIVSIILSIYALEQHIWGKDLYRIITYDHFGEKFRAPGFFTVSLTFAYVMGGFGVLLGAVAYFSKNKKSFFWIGSLASFVCVYASGTRGAWIALALTLLITTFILNKKLFLKCTVGLAILFCLLLLNSNFQKRAKTLVDIKSSGSNISRINIWNGYIEMAKDHFWFGVGYSKNREFLAQYYEKLNIDKKEIITHAHNDYLQILVGSGILSLITYLSMIGFFLVKSYNLYKQALDNQSFLKGLAFGILGLQIYIYLGGMTQVNFADSVVNYSLVYYWSILFFIEKKLVNDEKQYN